METDYIRRSLAKRKLIAGPAPVREIATSRINVTPALLKFLKNRGRLPRMLGEDEKEFILAEGLPTYIAGVKFCEKTARDFHDEQAVAPRRRPHGGGIKGL